MKKENKSYAVYFIGGVVAGILSFLLNSKLYAGLGMAALLVFITLVLNKILGKEKVEWWIKNGIWIYIFMWIISWTVLYNL